MCPSCPQCPNLCHCGCFGGVSSYSSDNCVCCNREGMCYGYGALAWGIMCLVVPCLGIPLLAKSCVDLNCKCCINK